MVLTDSHKAALAQGRQESKIVRGYLTALRDRRPGRPVTLSSLKARVSTLRAQLVSETNPLKLLDLHQGLIDAETSMKNLEERPDLDELESEFIKVAGRYSTRKGISYEAWRNVGVPASILKSAGIGRSSSSETRISGTNQSEPEIRDHDPERELQSA